MNKIHGHFRLATAILLSWCIWPQSDDNKNNNNNKTQCASVHMRIIEHTKKNDGVPSIIFHP